MEKKNINIFKIILTIICTLAIFGGFGYVLWKGDIEGGYISFGVIAVCLVFALLFLKFTSKKLLLAFALAAIVTSGIFLQFVKFESASLVSICLLLGMELCLVLYTFTTLRGVGIIVSTLAVRALLCLLAYFLLPKYYAVSTLEMLQIVLILNEFVTLVTLLFHFKSQWLLALALLLLLISNIYVWLLSGGIEIFGLSAKLLEFLYKYDWGFIFKVPGTYLISLFSVWRASQAE